MLSHTSDQHPWFKDSRASRDGAKSDWYVWADPKPDGTPPTNWLSIFGGSAWEWDGGRKQYYLHNFLASQPDLNFHDPQVQDALLDMVRFWLERGVDGFRLDTINFYFHDEQLRNNPALDPSERNASIAPDVNPYNYQNHFYDKNRPENLAFLQRFRGLLDEYPGSTTVGEVGDAQRGLEIVGEYTSGGDKVHMCYSFEFLEGQPLTGTRVAEVLKAFETKAPDGWACWAFSNHDVERHASRWHLSEAAKRLHTALILSLRGSVCLYQGEELGLTEAYVSYEELQDPYGKQFWPKFKGRDGCRTPMVWSSDGATGGFSDGKPWLPVAMEHLPHAVTAQENDPGSLLNAYRSLVRMRKSLPALVRGRLEIVETSEATIGFIRRLDGEASVYCAFNLSDQPRETQMPAGNWRSIDDTGFAADTSPKTITLPPHQAYFAQER